VDLVACCTTSGVKPACRHIACTRSVQQRRALLREHHEGIAATLRRRTRCARQRVRGGSASTKGRQDGQHLQFRRRGLHPQQPDVDGSRAASASCCTVIGISCSSSSMPDRAGGSAR
jgi:hypothetical protein